LTSCGICCLPACLLPAWPTQLNTVTFPFICRRSVVFLSGDRGICEFAERQNPHIVTNVTNYGHGDSVIAVAPSLARERIKQGMAKALSGDLRAHPLPASLNYELRLRFRHHGDAFKCSFYPGARLEDSQTVVVESDTFTDVASVFQFF
jgi:D-amino peptidase